MTHAPTEFEQILTAALRAVNIPDTFTATLEHDQRSTFAHLELTSAPLASGRVLRGRLQYVPRSARIEWIAGYATSADLSDFPHALDAEAAPQWTSALITLRETLMGEPRLAPALAQISTVPVRSSGSGPGRNKVPLLDRFTPNSVHHLGKGYATWGIGPKSIGIDPAETETALANLIAVLEAWFDALSAPTA